MENCTTEKTPKEETTLEKHIKLWTALQEAIKELFRSTLHAMIVEEFNDFIEQRNNEDKPKDYRNGTYTRLCKSAQFGTVQYDMPRDRLAEFESAVFPPYQTRTENLESLIFNLFKKGMSMTEIKELLDIQYNTKLSIGLIDKIAKSMYSVAQDFNTRKIEKYYPILFADAITLNLKRAFPDKPKGEVDRECIMVILGVNAQGYKEILAFDMVANEGAGSWEELFNSVKERGLKNFEDPKIAVTDGLNGMSQALKSIFPNTKHQRCMLHLLRNILSKVKTKYQEEAKTDFQKVYTADSYEEAKKALYDFIDKWGKTYPSFRKYAELESELLCFYTFPKPLWKLLYTSNNIENFNSKLRRDAQKRITYNSYENALFCIVNVCEDYNKHCSRRKIRGYKEMTDEERKSMGFED